MPQGGMKKDGSETPRQAAQRELREELGIDNARIIGEIAALLTYDFPDFVQTAAFRGKYRGQQQWWFALLFEGVDSDIRLSNDHQDEPPEFVAWRWGELAEAPQLIAPWKKSVYDSVAAKFAPLASKLKQGLLL
jgi:putative (di)nucleoside polyphosphate hydrolase